MLRSRPAKDFALMEALYTPLFLRLSSVDWYTALSVNPMDPVQVGRFASVTRVDEGERRVADIVGKAARKGLS
jgi:hypothetical protein